MVTIEGKHILFGNKKVKLDFMIRKVVEFDNAIVVLIYDETVVPNNVIALDLDGKYLWKINDILQIKRPTGNVDIEKESNDKINVFSTLGIVFCIDINKAKLVKTTYLR